MVLSHRYRRNPDFVFRQIADERILVPIKQKVGDIEDLYTFNLTAARIWELFDGTRTLGDLRDLLATEFDIGDDDFTAHITTFVEQLLKIGAVTETSHTVTTDRE